MELKDSIFKYIQAKGIDLLQNILKNYAIIDNCVIKANRLAFNEASDFAMPIDVYLKKNKKDASSSPRTEVCPSQWLTWS